MKKKVLILLCAVACLSVTACGESKGSSTEAKNDTQVAQESSANTQEVETEEQKENENSGQSAIQEPEAQETPTQDTVIYNIGDSAQLKDWQVAVTDFKIVESIAEDYGEFRPDTEGNRYAQVFVTATNNGKQLMNFLPSFGYGDDVSAKLLYGDGYEFSATNLMGYSNEMHDASINPLSSQSGEIAFEIPESVVNSTDEILIQFSSGNDKIQFKVR